ncbi:ATP-binding protein [Sphaerisporangium siamense]|uniref:Two-component sensor histidine kinase n=1 Tax=Sphaerisporangium siamense TaxID=795645 RepID=A0A7W7GDV1_9ACTN|nr:ATP-binding protein [Sphaerisporangium siamense]MBB4703391.1 two-component sensor histidine kinase [Sphaerisporangium siamense]
MSEVFSVVSAIDQVPLARHRARGTLAAWGVDDEIVFTAGLIVTELVTNVAEHAAAESPSATVMLAADRHWVTVAVHDTHPRLPRALASPRDDDGGRGLRMVMLLAEEAGGRHSVEPAPGGGKHVVVHLPR